MFRLASFAVGAVLVFSFTATTAILTPGAAGVGAAGTSAQAIVRAVEARYRRAATLKAEFYERYSDGKGGDLSESGTVYFSRPGRMRWEYKSPQEKLFIVDGQNVWFYVPSDHAASRAKMRESSDWRTPIALLAGKADLGRICRAVELVGSPASGGNTNSDTQSGSAATSGPEDSERALNPENSVLRCTPRESSDEFGQPIRDVLLEADAQAYLVRVVVKQPGGLETEFRFGNWRENIPLTESEFHFQPPPGVAVVDEQSLAGQIY